MNAEITTTPEPSSPAAEAPSTPTLREAVTDVARAWAVRGLEGARNALKAGSRWLDQRASDVDALAIRLA